MQKKVRMILLLFIDVICVGISYYLSLWLRFDGIIEKQYYDVFVKNIIILITIKIIIYAVLRLYSSLWEYASVEELINIIIAVLLANALTVTYLFFIQSHLPRSVYVMVGAFDLFFIGSSRFSYRLIRKLKNGNILSKREIPSKVLVVGAGAAGAVISKELRYHSELNYDIVGFIDDDINKKGSLLNGYRVLGTTEDIKKIVKKQFVDEIIISISSAPKSDIKRIVNICNDTEAKVKILPGVYEFINGKVSINQIRDVRIEDLLGREEVKLDTDLVEDFIEDKCVMITGGGGSIGSELCRQVVKFAPRKIVLVDIYENGVYDLQMELNSLYDLENIEINVIIASVRDRSRIKDVMLNHKPDVIFHAAAHKHVPLMEANPCEAVKNNIVGTYNVASLADELGINKFVLISTDKAVNPTNVMGATKRFCELIVQAHAKHSKTTEFAAVRFGNVLGSNGSVIPLFKRQIAKGGPVTVTHKDIIRFFMTIPEAAQLVLQAGAMAKGGEIFILDMGEPVKIYDLAKDLIKLSGFIPNEDIKILFTGLRPGEKLYEELLMDEEGIKKTVHEKIYTGKPLKVKYKDVIAKVEKLGEVAMTNDNEELVKLLREYVPTYIDGKKINKKFLGR